MNRIHVLAWAAMPLIVSLHPGDAVGQTSTDPLAGAWTYISVDTVRPDGSRTAMYGPHPQGLVIFDGHGHYALVNARAEQPRFASNDRTTGTAEENKSVVLGSIAHFGTYVVDDASKTITFHIETSTFPNWNGVEQRRPFTLAGDDLKWTTPAASGGGSGEVVLKRLR
jgi:hypothetical protein